MTATYDRGLAERVTRLARIDAGAAAAVYAAGEAAGRRQAAAYWAAALAPAESALRRLIAAHDLTPYAELARRRGEVWDSDLGRWRPDWSVVWDSTARCWVPAPPAHRNTCRKDTAA